MPPLLLTLFILLALWLGLWLCAACVASNRFCLEKLNRFRMRLEVSLLSISVSMTVVAASAVYSKYFLKHQRHKLGMLWLNIGVICGLIGMPIGLGLLLYNTILLLRRLTPTEISHLEQGAEGLLLTAAIPGVTVPLNYAFSMWGALCISLTFHELGHFLAAILNKIQVSSVGVFLIAWIPGAYVDIDTMAPPVDHREEDSSSSVLPSHPHPHSLPSPISSYDMLGQLGKLQIFFAGVWHNFALSLLLPCIGFALKLCLMVLYSQGSGVSIVSQLKGSPLAEHLHPGSLITHIDQIPVHDMDAWHLTLFQTIPASSYPNGFCIPITFPSINDPDYGGTDCCQDAPTAESTPRRQCFDFINRDQIMGSTCFRARNVLTSAHARCGGVVNAGVKEWVGCDPSRICVSLRELKDDESLRLLVLSVEDEKNSDPTSTPTRSVLYVGSPATLAQISSSLSNFHPQSCFPKWIRWLLCVLTPVWESIFFFGKILIAVNLSLAMVNCLPIHFSDGTAALPVLYSCLSSREEIGNTQKRWIQALVHVTSVILAANVLGGLWLTR